MHAAGGFGGSALWRRGGVGAFADRVGVAARRERLVGHAGVGAPQTAGCGAGGDLVAARKGNRKRERNTKCGDWKWLKTTGYIDRNNWNLSTALLHCGACKWKWNKIRRVSCYPIACCHSLAAADSRPTGGRARRPEARRGCPTIHQAVHVASALSSPVTDLCCLITARINLMPCHTGVRRRVTSHTPLAPAACGPVALWPRLRINRTKMLILSSP